MNDLALYIGELRRENERLVAALSVLEQQHADAEKERDEYRFWNERVRVCEHHTQDVAAPVGDCLICNAEAAEAALQAAHDALRASVGFWIASPEEMDAAPLPEAQRRYLDLVLAALAAASAAAEHTETE